MQSYILITAFAAGFVWSVPAGAQSSPNTPSTAAAIQNPAVADDASRGSLSYQPITDARRVDWFIDSTVGPKSLGAGVVSAAWGTGFNNPPEYGPTWGGFAKRYGMRLTGVATGNAIEAGVGTLWNEDPRYFRAEEAAGKAAWATRRR